MSRILHAVVTVVLASLALAAVYLAGGLLAAAPAVIAACIALMAGVNLAMLFGGGADE